MSFAEAADQTHDAIMGATYSALCKHGYADLTMQDIADEFDKSRSLLHYHYDTKEELLVAFLDQAIGWRRERLRESDTEDPLARLVEFVDRFVIEPGEEQRETFALAITELRVQAAHNDEFREKLSARYDENVATIAAIVVDCADAGLFRQVNPHKTAHIMYTSLVGARTVQVTFGVERATFRMREGIARWIDHDLLAVDREVGEYQGGDFSKQRN
ncbi:TetR/AcrR family transcriptional regulator [Halosimplex marinum]|uniref:TetR/AcrR family transcriptional regulator n=1 Tax=Halosimplex marinum TaxID=3396620 RepID=UPI003F57628C